MSDTDSPIRLFFDVLVEQPRLEREGARPRQFEVTVTNGDTDHGYVVTAKSHGAARYSVWLDVADCFPDWGFGEFVKRCVVSTRITGQRTAYDYVREWYGVEVAVGDRVLAGGNPGRVAEPQSSNPRASMVQVMLDGHKVTGIYHPQEITSCRV